MRVQTEKLYHIWQARRQEARERCKFHFHLNHHVQNFYIFACFKFQFRGIIDSLIFSSFSGSS